jgi:hypothetical protein
MGVGHHPGLFWLSGAFTYSEMQFPSEVYFDLFKADHKGSFVIPA